jgi:hypothetical protein
MRILLTSDCTFLRWSLSVYYKTVLRRFLEFVFVVGFFAFLFNPATGVAASVKLPVTIVPASGDVRIVTAYATAEPGKLTVWGTGLERWPTHNPCHPQVSQVDARGKILAQALAEYEDADIALQNPRSHIPARRQVRFHIDLAPVPGVSQIFVQHHSQNEPKPTKGRLFGMWN